MEVFIVTQQHCSYLFRSEAWHQFGHILPVYGLRDPPQRPQHHVQNQDIVVVGEIIVVRTEATHLYTDGQQTNKMHSVNKNQTDLNFLKENERVCILRIRLDFIKLQSLFKFILYLFNTDIAFS